MKLCPKCCGLAHRVIGDRCSKCGMAFANDVYEVPTRKASALALAQSLI